MSVHISGGFNFYIEINDDIESVKEEPRYKCSNEKCMGNREEGSYHKSNNFCSICGSSIENFPVQVKYTSINAYDFCDEHLEGNEIVYSPNSYSGIPDNIWIYNYKLDFVSKNIGEFDLSEGGIVDISSINVPALLELFEQEEPAQKLISKLNEILGENGYKIKFGFIATYL